MWSLQKLLSLGAVRHESLAQFVLAYHPEHCDPGVQSCWKALSGVVARTPPHQRDAIVTRLHRFLTQPQAEEPARICFTAGCEIGIEVGGGSFCILPGDEDPACCDSLEFARLLDQLFARYEARLH